MLGLVPKTDSRPRHEPHEIRRRPRPYAAPEKSARPSWFTRCPATQTLAANATVTVALAHCIVHSRELITKVSQFEIFRVSQFEIFRR
jgi:hypothetical protein